MRDLPTVESEPWSGTWRVIKDTKKTGGDAQCEYPREPYTRDVRVAFGQWFEAEDDNIWMWDGSINVADTKMAFDSIDTHSVYGSSDSVETMVKVEKQGSGTATDGGFTITGTIDKKTTDFLDGESTVECRFDYTETGHL